VVEADHLVLDAQFLDHVDPVEPAAGEAVDQDERLPGAAPIAGDRDRAVGHVELAHRSPPRPSLLLFQRPRPHAGSLGGREAA
jgi:hypothetical protein